MNWYKQSQVERDLDCPECGGKLRLKKHHQYGDYYECESGCGVRHGAKANGEPQGIPGDLETIALRKAAHTKFDSLWREDPEPDGARTRWYHWLSRKLGVHKNECHMALFDKETLRRVIGLCEFQLNNRRKAEENKGQQPELDFGI